MEEKRANAVALHNYTVSNPEEKVADIPSGNAEPDTERNEPPEVAAQAIAPEKENVLPQNALIPFEANLQQPQPM